MTDLIKKPKRLKPGDKIGVIAPSSAVRDERLQRGIEQIENRGYYVELGSHVFDQHGFLAGLDKHRADDLTQFFLRDDIAAVFCARGGYGAMRMVDLIDWDAIRDRCKIFAGYSDITTLHLRIAREMKMVTFHGPVVTTLGGDLDASAAHCFWSILESDDPFGKYPQSDNVKTLNPGTASGRLAGGCIELLADSIGTLEQPDFTSCIVLLEDVGEKAYQVDRQLVQMIRARLFDGAAGIVVGTVTDWDKDETTTPPINLQDIWRNNLGPLGIPTILDFPFGHEPYPMTLPLGCVATLNANTGSLALNESAVR